MQVNLINTIVLMFHSNAFQFYMRDIERLVNSSDNALFSSSLNYTKILWCVFEPFSKVDVLDCQGLYTVKHYLGKFNFKFDTKY